MLPQFPHELVPDGMVWAAHHYVYLCLAAAFTTFTVWDDYPGREPLAATGGLAVGVFAFLFMWPVRGYHALGALVALAAPLVAVAAVLRPGGPWRRPASDGGYPRTKAAVVVVLAVGGLDDAVEHAFGVPTPLDVAFGVLGVWGSAALLVVAAAGVAAAAWTWTRVPWGTNG